VAPKRLCTPLTLTDFDPTSYIKKHPSEKHNNEHPPTPIHHDRFRPNGKLRLQTTLARDQ